MALADIQIAIDRRTGLAIDPAAQVSLINQSLHELATEKDWPWLDASQTITGDGVTTVWPLPSTWIRTRTVTVGTAECRVINIGDMDRWINFEDRPMQYCYSIDAGNLIINDPIPLSTTTIHRYVQSEPGLVGASDVPLLPSRFHNTLVSLVALYEFERVGDVKRVAMLRDEVQRGIARMNDEQQRTHGPMRPRVRDGFPL